MKLKVVENKKDVTDMERLVSQFDITDILPIGMTFIVLGIAMTYGLNVMGDVQDDMTENSTEWNASRDAMAGVSKFPEKMALLATIIIAAIVIGILTRYLMVRYQ